MARKSQQLYITIDTDNDAFEYARDHELEKIFTSIRYAISAGEFNGWLDDSNGNRVGSWRLANLNRRKPAQGEQPAARRCEFNNMLNGERSLRR